MSGEVIGRICYKRGSGAVAFKHGGAAPVYKSGTQRGPATITISWGSGDRDLDVCGYWRGNESNAVGWNHNNQSQDPYYASWGGDNTSEGGSETIRVQMNPWSFPGTRWYYVKFNFYGKSEGAGTCTVTVTQGSKTLTANNVQCSKNRGERATSGDPGVVAKFNDLGDLLSLEVA